MAGAFQPDACMLGLCLAGLRLWDGGRSLAIPLLAIGIATKVTGAFLLIPFMVIGLESGRPRRALAACGLILLPAALWYLHAASGLADASASTENAANWWARLSRFSSAEWGLIGRDLAIRAFTPLGSLLAVFGLVSARPLARIWRYWAWATLLSLLLLAGKLHHEYYWMMAAPIVAILAASGLKRAGRMGGGILVAFVVLAAFQTKSTWTTPAEWCGLMEAGASIRDRTEPYERLIAPEALLYAADRRGCRLEWEPNSVRRALREWRLDPEEVGSGAESLVGAYERAAHASVFADLRGRGLDARRSALHDGLRRRADATILVDRPGGFLLIRLNGPDVAERNHPRGNADVEPR